jgi:hypothetical protein
MLKCLISKAGISEQILVLIYEQMLLRIFKQTGPGVILLIVLTLAGVWASALLNQRLHPRFIYETDPMPLYGLLKAAISNSHTIGVILSFLMVSIMAFLLVNFNTTVFFIHERTFLPAFFYILLGGIFPDHQLLNPVLPASIFLILAIIRIMDGYHITGTAYSYFDAGLLISTGSLFYASLLWFGILVIVGIALLRTGNLKELFIGILGLILPYLLAFGIYYVIGKDPVLLWKQLGDNMFTKATYYPFPRLTIVTLIYCGALILIGLAQVFNQMNSKKIKSRKTFSLLNWILIVSIIIYIVLPSTSIEIIWITAIPVCYLLSHYFVFAKKKLMPEILFSFLLLFVFLIQVWNLR